MKLTYRLAALSTLLVAAYGGGMVLSACSSNGDNKDGGSDGSSGDTGTKKDSGQQDTGPGGDAADDSAGPTLDPQCTVPAVGTGSCAPAIDDAGVQCNPITNAGCDAGGGETCDFGDNGNNQTTIQCFPPPNPQDVCATCDNSQGPFCKPSDHCVGTAQGSACARMCCTDSDCTPGHCDTTSLGFAPIGVCVK